MPALTRDEATTRARIIDVRSYSLDLDLTRGDDVFGSATAVRFACREPGAATFIEIKPAALRRAVLNGRELGPSALAGNRLALDALAAENELLVEADMRYSHTGEGMHRFTDPVDGQVYLYQQGFLDDAQRVFAAFDQPDLKAVFEIAVTAPPEWTVIGNGTAEQTAPGRFKLAATPPISTYLATVVAGPYHRVRAEHDGIPLGLYCRRTLAPYLDADADELFEITRRCFDRYHQIFHERYPFGSYDQAFVPEFNAGAMENPGCVTLREDFVFRSAVTETEREQRAMVIAHEMAHMWFGDLVTMRWWDDLWLNESFAEYMGHQIISEATRFSETWTGFAVRRKSWGYDADQRPSTHPVSGEVHDTAAALLNFDGISYAKGASALRQLVAWLGRETFLAGINEHFARHRFGNASLADLLDALAGTSGRDVHGWAERWLRTTGVDTLRPGPGGGGAQRPHRIAIGLYDKDGADEAAKLVLRERIEADVAPEAAAPIPAPAPGHDLMLINHGDLTYAKVRFDDVSWRTVVASLGAVEEPLSRAVLWTAARDMVRDGELPAAAFVEMVARHLPREPVVAIVEAVLDFARHQVADRFLPPARRRDALAALHGVCRDILRRTEDGSSPGLRLAAVRGAIACAEKPRHAAELADWLASDRVPGGPALDPGLRWQILLRLAVLGAAGEAEIAAELERDPTAAGREGAARCRAARPEAEAKEAAWQALFEDDGLSNYLLIATAEGLWQPEQSELLADRVPRYFPDAVATAGRRGPAVAALLGQRAFPAYAAEKETLRAGEECLAGGDVPPALRRRLIDQLDDLGRAVRARHAEA